MTGISQITETGNKLLQLCFAVDSIVELLESPATPSPNANPTTTPIPQNFRRLGKLGLTGKLGGSRTRNRSPCWSSSMLVAIADSFFFFEQVVVGCLGLVIAASQVGELLLAHGLLIQASLVIIDLRLRARDRLLPVLDLDLIGLQLALQLWH